MTSQHKMPDKEAYWGTAVHIRISEAKNLVSKDGSDVDSYCMVCVDDETVASTSAVWKNSSPFFGEDFYLDLPPQFQDLAIYVLQNGKSSSAYGKVVLDKKKLETASKASDQWFPLMNVCRETEVFGEVYVELTLSKTQHGVDHLTVCVARCRDLYDKYFTGKLDPFAIVMLDQQKETTARSGQNTRFPTWTDTFRFMRARVGPFLTVTIRSDNGISGTSFLGEAIVPLTGLEYDVQRTGWYKLKPRAKDLMGNVEGFGSIRLTVKFEHELYMPLSQYSFLAEFLQRIVSQNHLYDTGFIDILEEMILAKEQTHLVTREEVARILVRAYLHVGSCVPFIQQLSAFEIAKTTESSTLFRGNSIATKCVDQFMKIVGLRYLRDTLKNVLDDIFKSKKDLEIDPSKIIVKKASALKETIQKRASVLSQFLESILSAIYSSMSKCPVPMRHIFQSLQQYVKENPHMSVKGGEAQYTVVSGFLFLRFFAAAVLSPKLFGLREELADACTSRTLTLLAKALQTIGNLGSTMGSGKEEYMEVLHPVIIANIDRVKAYIDQLCAIDPSIRDAESKEDIDAIILPYEALPCRGNMHPALSIGSFKKIPIMLSATSFRMGAKDSHLDIPLAMIGGVELMDYTAFSKKHVFQMFTKDQIIMVSVGSLIEFEIWLKALRKGCRACGAVLRPSTHSGFYAKQWSCCKSFDRNAPPCSKTHNAVVIDQFADNPGPELWLHKLFLMLHAFRANIDEKGKQAGPKGEISQSLHHILEEIEVKRLLLAEVSIPTELMSSVINIME